MFTDGLTNIADVVFSTDPLPTVQAYVIPAGGNKEPRKAYVPVQMVL